MSEAVGERHRWLRLMVGDAHLRACAVFTAIMLLMPPEGLGVDLCMCQWYTHSPCPACGITRCGSNMARGHFLRAAQFHPLGPAVVSLIAVLGVLALLPRRWREAIRAALMRRADLLRPLYWGSIWAFALFGAGRWALVILVHLGWVHVPVEVFPGS